MFFFLHQAANGTRHPPTLTQTTRNSYFSLNRSACGVQEKQMRPTYSVEMLNKSWHCGLDYFFFFHSRADGKIQSLQICSDDSHSK